MKNAAARLTACLIVMVAAATPAAAQGTRREMDARLTAVIEKRLTSNQPLRLSADSITLTRQTLRLAGHAKIWFEDTVIMANEAVIDQAMNQVEMTGPVHALLGKSARDAFTKAQPPRYK